MHKSTPGVALARRAPSTEIGPARPGPDGLRSQVRHVTGHTVPLSLPLVVLAAGLSTRYGRLKQLEPLGPSGEAIMDYNVFDALRAGFGHATFVVREEILEQVRRHVHRTLGGDLPHDFVIQRLDDLPEGFRPPPDRRKPWGTGQAVILAGQRHAGPFAVCNADDLYGPGAFELLHAYLRQDPVPTEGVLVGYRLADTLVGSGGVARGICHVGRDGLLEHVIEIQDIRRKDAWIVGVEGEATQVELSGDELVSMNLWGFTPPLVVGLRRRFLEFLDLWGANVTRELHLSSAVNAQIQVGAARVRALHARDPWYGLTHADDEGPMRALLHRRIEEGVYPRRLADALPVAVS